MPWRRDVGKLVAVLQKFVFLEKIEFVSQGIFYSNSECIVQEYHKQS
jgi:hypothetical protein